MTLPELFRQKLSAFSSTGRSLVVVSTPPRQIRCEVAEARPLAVSFDRLELTTDELASVTIDELQAVARDLTDRVTYLLEPIGPVEVDHEKCVVQMRSLPPSKDDTSHSYYELLVRRGGSLSLCRYRKAPGDVRQPIPATVTREVLERLVGDFCGAVDGV